MANNIIRIGTRGSNLALRQTEWVVDRLRSAFPDRQFTITIISTTGDRVQNRPIFEAGTVGVFVRELEAALLNGEIDIAVHSMKDLPSRIIPGLSITAVPEREDPRDVIISRLGLRLTELPEGAKVGTSSRRRTAQILIRRPDIKVVNIRGNVDTRLEKANTEAFDAIILAMAGLIRLGRDSQITQILEPEVMLPAAGQGALAVQTRTVDNHTNGLVRFIDHTKSRSTVLAERKFVDVLGGGCHTPVAAYGQINENKLLLRGLVASLDGEKVIKGFNQGPIDEAEQIGKCLAEELIEKGARKLLAITSRE